MTTTGEHDELSQPPLPADLPRRPDTFSSLRIERYRLLFIAGMFSFVAVQSEIVARGWLANELTGTNSGLGGVYMAFGIPMLLATPWGGVVADRVSKRLVLMCAQLTLMATSLWIGIAVTFDAVAYWMLLATAAIQAVAFSFVGPARMAMTSELVGRELLTNAIVLGQMSLNLTRVVGPAFAGIAIGIAWFGTSGVYFAAATLSLISAILMVPLPAGRSERTTPPRSPTRELVDGLSYVRRHRDVRLLLITSFVVVMVGFPFIAFLPRVATEIFDVGAVGYGALSAASAVGAIVVSLLIARTGGGRSTWRIQTVSGLAFGVGLVLLAVSPTYAVALLSVGVVGAASSGFQSTNNSLVLGLSEFAYHGRMQSLMMLSFAGFGMAALPLGAIADSIGLRSTFFWMGVVTVAAMATYVLVRNRSAGLADGLDLADRVGDAARP
ncbi:MAG: MFS transporter [Ilumatobacteraceae bacterium]|jgi:predicted MFS family arabinose efflux permease|nr:MFS transporter [Ilumatobacteraceae bacterium]